MFWQVWGFASHTGGENYPGVVEIVPKLGVIVKVGGCIVPVGVGSQNGMTNSRFGRSNPFVKLLACRINSGETENFRAILSSVSPS